MKRLDCLKALSKSILKIFVSKFQKMGHLRRRHKHVPFWDNGCIFLQLANVGHGDVWNGKKFSQKPK